MYFIFCGKIISSNVENKSRNRKISRSSGIQNPLACNQRLDNSGYQTKTITIAKGSVLTLG